MTDFTFKTKPFRHQAKIFDEHRDDEAYALFWEMGLGKTKLLLDVAAYRFLNGSIRALLIVAPNSVYPNWTNIEAPIHLPVPHVTFRHRSGSGDEKRMRRAMFLDPSTIDSSRRLRVVAMSYDSLLTEDGEEFAQRLVKLYPTMMVLDESTAIKNRDTRRAKTCKHLGRQCVSRWIATGTPTAQSPFDLHSQIEFLLPDFWKENGLKSWSAFKQEFGQYEMQRFGDRTFQKVSGYRNLRQLRELTAPICSRLLKEDSEVELPPKIYSIRTFEMLDKQRDVYEKMRKGILAEISRDPITFAQEGLAATRAIRLQQIASGFVTAEEAPEDLDPQEFLGDEPFSGIDHSVAPEPLVTDDWNTGDPSTKDDSDYAAAIGQPQFFERESNDGTIVGNYVPLVKTPNRPISLALIEEGVEQAMRPPRQQVELYSPQDIEFLSQHTDKLNPDLKAFVENQADEIRAFEIKRKVVDIIPPAENPRLNLLCEILDECTPQRVIVYCRFTRDVEMICDRLGDIAVRYDGKVRQRTREENIETFKDADNKVRVLVANVHALSMGLTLTIAKRSIYFSNSFSLEKRLQSEDRNHRPGQDVGVHIIDIVAEDTIDYHVVESLRKKFNIAAEVNGDRLREWITTEGDND